jgi:hypothetical protein
VALTDAEVVAELSERARDALVDLVIRQAERRDQPVESCSS